MQFLIAWCVASTIYRFIFWTQLCRNSSSVYGACTGTLWSLGVYSTFCRLSEEYFSFRWLWEAPFGCLYIMLCLNFFDQRMEPPGINILFLYLTHFTFVLCFFSEFLNVLIPCFDSMGSLEMWKWQQGLPRMSTFLLYAMSHMGGFSFHNVP